MNFIITVVVLDVVAVFLELLLHHNFDRVNFPPFSLPPVVLFLRNAAAADQVRLHGNSGNKECHLSQCLCQKKCKSAQE